MHTPSETLDRAVDVVLEGLRRDPRRPALLLVAGGHRSSGRIANRCDRSASFVSAGGRSGSRGAIAHRPGVHDARCHAPICALTDDSRASPESPDVGPVSTRGRSPEAQEEPVPDLLVDFITSLDGYASGEGWPGFWGLEGPEYLAWLGEQPEATTSDGSEHLPADVGLRAAERRARHRRAGRAHAEGGVLLSLDEPLTWANTRLVAAGRRRGGPGDEGGRRHPR